MARNKKANFLPDKGGQYSPVYPIIVLTFHNVSIVTNSDPLINKWVLNCSLPFI